VFFYDGNSGSLRFVAKQAQLLHPSQLPRLRQGCAATSTEHLLLPATAAHCENDPLLQNFIIRWDGDAKAAVSTLLMAKLRDDTYMA
jgi:hypothetical protein